MITKNKFKNSTLIQVIGFLFLSLYLMLTLKKKQKLRIIILKKYIFKRNFRIKNKLQYIR